MGTVSLRRGRVVNYMRVLSWTHDTIVAEVPEGVGAGYSLVVSVRHCLAGFLSSAKKHLHGSQDPYGRKRERNPSARCTFE